MTKITVKICTVKTAMKIQVPMVTRIPTMIWVPEGASSYLPTQCGAFNKLNICGKGATVFRYLKKKISTLKRLFPDLPSLNVRGALHAGVIADCWVSYPPSSRTPGARIKQEKSIHDRQLDIFLTHKAHLKITWAKMLWNPSTSMIRLTFDVL